MSRNAGSGNAECGIIRENVVQRLCSAEFQKLLPIAQTRTNDHVPTTFSNCIHEQGHTVRNNVCRVSTVSTMFPSAVSGGHNIHDSARSLQKRSPRGYPATASRGPNHAGRDRLSHQRSDKETILNRTRPDPYTYKEKNRKKENNLFVLQSGKTLYFTSF